MSKSAEAGITAILATPGSDGIRGQSALVLTSIGADLPQIGALADDRRGGLVVARRWRLHVGTADSPAGGNAYPNSLMGIIAFNRQAFLDAQWYQQAKNRPHSAALEAMQPALAGRLPVAFRASTSREVLRALDMAKAFKLDPIITAAAAGRRCDGGFEGRQRAGDLQPELPDAAGRRWRRMPTNRSACCASAPTRRKAPAALDKAGVLFAFESAGLSDPKDFLKNAQKTVANGLSKDAALKALTLNAATLAGAADRLGSLDRGKIANLVVTEGDLFDEKTAIKHVFVNGRPVKLN